MKKFGIIIFVAALGLGLILSNLFSFGRASADIFNLSFDFGRVAGSGQMSSEVRGLSDFEAIEVGGVFEVMITTQKDFAVEVEADDNLLPFITTEVVNGTLKIETEKRLKTSNPIRIRISAPDLASLNVSGVANVTVRDLKNNAFTVDASGASKIKVGGETSKLTIDVSGATKVDADGLSTVNAKVDASGASHVVVNVSGKLLADASGASKVLYSGQPTDIKETSSGASKVAAND